MDFDQAWAQKKAQGYQYGKGPLELVRMGYEMAKAEAADTIAKIAPAQPAAQPVAIPAAAYLANLLEDWANDFGDCLEGGEDDELMKATREAVSQLRAAPARLEQPAAQPVAIPAGYMAMRDALEQCTKLFEQALPKFNWGASFLDGNAIALLNNVPIAVAKALEAAPAVTPTREPLCEDEGCFHQGTPHICITRTSTVTSTVSADIETLEVENRMLRERNARLETERTLLNGEPVAAQRRTRTILKDHPFYESNKDFGPWQDCKLSIVPPNRRYIDHLAETEFRLLCVVPE